VLDSSFRADTAERASAFVLYGMVEFFKGGDSTAARAFQAALDSGSTCGAIGCSGGLFPGRLWRRERTRAICGTPEPVAVDFLSDSGASQPRRFSPRTCGPVRAAAALSANMLRSGVQGRVIAPR